MVTLNMLTEVLRRHGIGDPVSKISVDLKTPESTIRDWLKFAQQHSLTFTKIAGMTLKQFKEIRAQSSQPCARMLQPDWDYIVAESRKPGVTLQSLYEAYFRTAPAEPHMKRSSFYLKYKQIKETVDVDVMRLCLHNSFRPAEVVMIDYSGDVLKGKDKGGHAFKGQVFVAVLGLYILHGDAGANTGRLVSCHERHVFVLRWFHRGIMARQLNASCQKTRSDRPSFNP